MSSIAIGSNKSLPMARSKSDSSDDTGGSAGSKIEAENVANLLAMLKSGKSLSRAQLTQIDDYNEKKSAVGRVADNLPAAAAMSGIDLDTIGKSKAAGCPAFRGSRIYVDELIEWVDDHGDTLPSGSSEIDLINIEIAKERHRKWKIENDAKEGLTINRQDVATQILALGLELKRILRYKLEDDAPRRQRQKTEAELRIVNRKLVDEICSIMEKGSETWKPKP